MNVKKIKGKIRRRLEKTETARIYVCGLMLTALVFGSDKFVSMAKSSVAGGAVYLAYCLTMILLPLLGCFGGDDA